MTPPIMGIVFALGSLHECAANFSAFTIIRVSQTRILCTSPAEEKNQE